MKILYFEKCFMFCQHAGKVLTICTLESCRLSTLFFFLFPLTLMARVYFFASKKLIRFLCCPMSTSFQ